MELLQLQYFATVAETENISRSAKIHMIPQPDMSVTISRLENEIGTPLFSRTGNKIFLNERGRVFYNFVKSALRSIEDAKSSTSDSHELAGSVKLLVLENRRITTECILAFREKHPLVNFSICHNLYNDLYTDFDLCISSITPSRTGISGKVLVSEEIAVAVNRTHPFAGLSSIQPLMLKNERFIFLPPNNSVNIMANAYCLEHGFTPDISIICDDPFYIRKYISLGFGIAFVPTLSWYGMYDENTLIIPLQGKKIIRETSVFTRTDKYIGESVKAFADELAATFSASSYKLYGTAHNNPCY